MFGWFKRKSAAPLRLEITIRVEPIQINGIQIQAHRSESAASQGHGMGGPSDSKTDEIEPEISISANLESPAVGFGKKVE